MALAKSHGLKVAKERKAKPSKYTLKNDEYAAVEDTVAKVYVDICNCVSKSDILEKIMNGLYGNRPCKKRHSYEYYNAALSRLQEDRDNEQEDLKNIFYARYESLLADAVESGDRATAKGILDSMVKFFLGLDKQNNVQITTTANDENKVEIKFGYNDA